MDSPIKEELGGKKLYELPVCSICLCDLNEELVNLQCGHCYHDQCIRQQLEYAGECPLCRERAHFKQIRRVVYTVMENSATMVHLQSLLMSLDNSEKKQIEQLLLEVKKEHERSERLVNQDKTHREEIAHLTKTLQALRVSVKESN